MKRPTLKSLLIASAALMSALGAAFAQQDGPNSLPMPAAIPAPQDTAYPGTIKLAVDATDMVHGIFRVHEVV